MTSRTRITALLLTSAIVVGLWAYANRNADAQQTFSSPMIVSVGVCDPHEAFRTYLKVTELRQELRAQSDQLRQEVEAKDKQLRDKTEELTASQLAPGSQEYERMHENLVKLTIEAKTFREVSEAQLRIQDMRITQIGYNDVYAAIAELAKKKQLTVVLSRERLSLASARPDELFSKLYYRIPVLYADESLNITAEVADLLNTKYKLGT